MSGSNAISGITLVGAIIAAGSIDIQLSGLWDSITVTSILGFVAIIFATINVVGGFLVTDRMLKMFKR
jgi:NAD(P) transhydrogenase subunit alpha